ncbi:hypothetical protein CMO83_03970 [Candidatus Woesearchaeota archaeon]|jgi:predicted amidohydrolase|nr:hypothetical protein [Candidatus Woesearchaeota archaeon]MAG91807.1 hypothetical protein [Candidatus Woesearchaeota archaeon]|tara:strand:+ start:5841 stop:6677 length:837 start_codon:yes stop_codon:yes gene_type:complete
MPKTKVCAVQSLVHPSFERNLAKAEQFFRKASRLNCNIICFPEIFLTGPLNKQEYNPKIPILSKKIFSKLTKNYGMFAVMGSIKEKINGNFYNVSYLFDDKGKILGNYKKNHLQSNSEALYVKADTKVSVFKTKIGNIGIEICKDLLFPEVTRRLLLKGAEIVFCPSFWCSYSEVYSPIYNKKYFKNKKPVEVVTFVPARAIESEVFFVYANAAGTSKSSHGKDVLLGKTQIAMPFYGTTDILDHNKEGMLVKELDLSIIRDAKKVYKVEQDAKRYYK